MKTHLKYYLLLTLTLILVKWKGVVYHFYCAVDNKDHRGIAVATSKPLFPKGELR